MLSIALPIAIVIAAYMQLSCYDAFSVEAGAMMPALQPGDRFVASECAYRRGDAGIPPASEVVGQDEPERGDIVVFRQPVSGDVHVKRLMGKPGDTVQMRNGRVVLNGAVLPQERTGGYKARSYDLKFEMYRETLPNGRSYSVLNRMNGSASDDTRLFQVPPGHYFFLGDNRDNSFDSRFTVGVVPRDHLIGKAIRIYDNIQGDLNSTRQDLTFQ